MTACGARTDDAADAAADTASPPDATAVDVASPDGDAGGSIIIITIDGQDPREDVRNDPRCCVITN